MHQLVDAALDGDVQALLILRTLLSHRTLFEPSIRPTELRDPF
jgi:hypothetical protein